MRLSPFLASHFMADTREDVPASVWQSAITSTKRVLDSPEKFPRADFDYLHKLEHELLAHTL